ncbi:sulfurtransferase complex subunit TusB [Marimonas arenosa]|uniref:Sulfurtransferase complex subunit TusB n=1 Tax=Marimonas arenosa TaxID=1795305 RepID=A0AAE3WCZ5_9RHOB|nr:sulfurtransferase complex subunit TusB [Marimonas arenosa]MDQ2089380.1 sulfurtransferase complex subunit TusB [Marimonas arenosa]
MATLHTVNKSPFMTQTLLSCINHAKDGDAILMIEDGVYGGMAGTGLSDAVAAKAASLNICVLTEDLEARGLDAGRLVEGVSAVGYDGFVDLVAETDRTQAWL